MAELDLVKTGISGLDAILSSGIPRGNVILLEGGIGTGKTTMGVEFVYRGARGPAPREAGRLLLEDEAKFIDLARSPLWFNREYEIVKNQSLMS